MSSGLSRFAICAAAALLFALAIACDAHAAVKPGDMPPAYLGKTVKDQAVSLSALRGDVVVISFWATWCHYCLQELPILAGLQAVAAKRGLRMQVVAVDYREPRHTFARAAHLLTKRLPSLIITRDYNGSIGKPFGAARGIPVMVMLHRDGTVAHIHVGYDEHELDKLIGEINGLLSEPLTPVAASSP